MYAPGPTSAPLLQKWFASTGHGAAKNGSSLSWPMFPA